ncbi:hypothetical protein GN156_04065 [bacterium LRH843]|nr:hypothetical protein [bacterium LRH843]
MPNQKILEEVAKISAKTAVQTALEFLEKERRKQEKQKHDRRLRNIKLLLSNYRSFVKHCEDIKIAIKDIDNKIEWAMLDSEEFDLMSIRRSKEKTLAMVRYIDKMMAVYKVMCVEDGAESERRYQVIKSLYIDNPKKSMVELSNVHFLSEKTIRRDRDKACEALSVLMFGVDAIRFNE